MDHDQDPEVESEKQMLLTIENATTDCFDETQVEVTLDGTEAGKAAEEMNHDRLRCQKAKEEQEWRELYLKEPTKPVYQHSPHLRSHMTVVTSVTPLPCLPEAEKIGLFKQFCTDPTEWYCVITKQSIFFPQSGGQPSDLGAMAGCGSIFKVMQVRSTPTQCIIHLGTFSGPDHFVSSVEVVQEIDSERRTLNSVYHTAGHVLNDAVLQLNNGLGIEGHGVSKAHFFPSGSYVEFDGLIASSKKGSIQEKVDELLNSNLKVLTKWWNAEELVAKKAFGLDRYSVPEYEGERTRVTVIDGLSAWACCGTHVEFTGDVGRIIVGGFRRRHGKTSVGYKVGMGRKDCEE